MKTCSEKPELLKEMGMYHCPACGMMVMGGLPHLISDGVICLACGANEETRGDPKCPHCNFPDYDPSKYPDPDEDVDL